MRKIISVTVVVLLVAAMLSSTALAQGTKDSNSGRGAGMGQKQDRSASDQGEAEIFHGSDHAPADRVSDKSPADGNVISDDAGDSNVEDASGDTMKDKEKNHGIMPLTGPDHGNAYGRQANVQKTLDAIGQLTDMDTTAQLNTLFAEYRNAKDEETARTALNDLLDSLSLACATAASNINGEEITAQEQITLMNMDMLREKVMGNAGNDNGTLLALMHAYENALRIMNHLEPVDYTDNDTEIGSDAEAAAIPSN